MIADLIEVKSLINCQNLKTLWLSENPVAEKTKNYRLCVIKTLPQLTKLDDTIISMEEKQKAENFVMDSFSSATEEDDPFVEEELEVNNNKGIINN